MSSRLLGFSPLTGWPSESERRGEKQDAAAREDTPQTSYAGVSQGVAPFRIEEEKLE